MKKLILLSLTLYAMLAMLPVSAQVAAQNDQANQTITLNDTTPTIVAAINLPADTTGVISINFSQAAITLQNQAGDLVFRAADPRLHTVELSIAPNTGAHTLTIDRLPGVAEAYVSLLALPELSATSPTTMQAQPQLVDHEVLALNQEHMLTLSPDVPGGQISLKIPDTTIGLITATFPGASMTSQLVDSNGTVVASSLRDLDGFNFVIDSGDYQMTLLASDLTSDITAGVRIMPAEANGFVVMQPPADVAAADTQTVDCNATILPSSVNLRSGPGTGYSVLEYGYHNQTYPVGGTNPQQNWIVVGTDNASGWVSRNLAQLSGTCDQLTVYDIPLRQAKPAQIVIETIQEPAASTASSNNNNSGGGSTNTGNHDEGEHEDHEDHDEGHDD
ncbi:MAG TPA: hypothetical protein VHL11_21000 [Phototrophicaceae bacterium]|jgi:SH3-like domain-containing protein|nr:hypothetical protein [Phototrophicaceae bacterium]